jgi:hypothetical protein
MSQAAPGFDSTFQITSDILQAFVQKILWNTLSLFVFSLMGSFSKYIFHESKDELAFILCGAD